MDNAKWTFGLTMMIVGMGGTFLTLWILGLVMDLLKKVFPLVSNSRQPGEEITRQPWSGTALDQVFPSFLRDL